MPSKINENHSLGAFGLDLYDFSIFGGARFLMFFRPTRSEAKMRKTPPGTVIGVLGTAIGVPGCRPRPGTSYRVIYVLGLTRATRAQALSYILHKHQT